jgi:hypothetical protein
MSDKAEGPGWWIASDGKWYPPELHPTPPEESKGPKPESAPAPAPAPQQTKGVVNPSAPRWQGAEKGTPQGRQFPDLFQKALQGSHLADNVTVKYDGDDQRNVPTTMTTRPGPLSDATTGGGVPVAAGTAGVSFGAPTTTKRRWRKAR